jgi:uncharacterized membrane protein YoaK (UPF0700 family)
VNRALALELVIFTGFAVGWFVTVGEPDKAVQFGLLLALATALGVQSSTVQRFGVSGLSTTYLTGTLTSAVIHLVAHRTARGSERHWSIIGALVLGATAAAGMHEVAGPALPVPQLVGLALVLAFGVRATRRDARATAEPGYRCAHSVRPWSEPPAGSRHPRRTRIRQGWPCWRDPGRIAQSEV